MLWLLNLSSGKIEETTKSGFQWKQTLNTCNLNRCYIWSVNTSPYTLSLYCVEELTQKFNLLLKEKGRNSPLPNSHLQHCTGAKSICSSCTGERPLDPYWKIWQVQLQRYVATVVAYVDGHPICEFNHMSVIPIRCLSIYPSKSSHTCLTWLLSQFIQSASTNITPGVALAKYCPLCTLHIPGCHCLTG